MFRNDTREYADVTNNLVEFTVAHDAHATTIKHLVAVRNHTELPSDMICRFEVIARDHADGYAGG
ncbi:hypothetical protein D3C72_2057470 [compost metagenome]